MRVSIWIRKRIRDLFVAGAALMLPSAIGVSQSQVTAQQQNNLVLIELFTSEGCSTCPPADRVLLELKRQQPLPNAEIVALGFHVDYWNREGWRDRFSSSKFTERQQKYAQQLHDPRHDEIYTPQFVIDGATPVADLSELGGAITRAAAEQKPLKVTATLRNREIEIRVEGPSSSSAEAYVAVVEDDLQTEVQSGENKGRRLQHVAVVRSWRSLGRVSGDAWIHAAQLEVPKDVEPSRAQIVAVVQDSKTGKILGARSIPLRLGT